MDSEGVEILRTSTENCGPSEDKVDVEDVETFVVLEETPGSRVPCGHGIVQMTVKTQGS